MTNDTIQNPDEVVVPDLTQRALEDPGWIAACLYVTEVGNQVFGGTAMIIALPDPEGFYQQQSGKSASKSGIFIEVNSMAVPGLAASLVVPMEIDAFGEVRHVMANLMGQLRTAEIQRTDPSAALLVPDKKLIIPGRD